MSKKNVIGGLSLVALGAAAAVAASHVQINWGPTANAAPVVAAEVKPALPPPSPQALSDAKSFSHTLAQIAAQLSPSVVRISITKNGSSHRQIMHRGGNGGPFGGNPFEGTPFERFFGDNGDDGPQPKQKGLGSGVVIDKRGYILTNNHVVEDADEVKVNFVDGKTVDGKVVGTDPKSDLAVVKVSGVNVTPARLGDSDKMEVGEFVMAIGNPFGLDHTVTVGVLSAKNRAGLQGNSSYQDFLQTDASINPGNSGGPLVNVNGEVIGINTMILNGSGIGFAVPSSLAKPVVDQLIETGHVRRPFVGIKMQMLTPEIRMTLGKDAPEKGAFVGDVDKGKPADAAGVRPGDIIVAVNGQPIGENRDVQKDVLATKIGQKVDLTVWRDGKTMHLYPVTRELPGEDAVATREVGDDRQGNVEHTRGKLGLALSSLTPGIAQQIGIEAQAKGAVITQVRDGSPAQEAGLQQGDVIIEVDRRPVSTADDAVSALSSKKAPMHLVRVRRGNDALYVTLPAA